MFHNDVTQRSGNGALKLFLLLIAAMPLVFGTMDAIWASSTDLAHHYALTARLFQSWSWSGINDPSLGEMNYYPRGSHQLAALLGQLLGSPLAGMQLLSGLSIFAAWAGLCALVTALPRRAGWAAAITLALLLLANRNLVHLYLHGKEIDGYYFYAQLVAQAGAVLALQCVFKLEQHGVSAGYRHLFLIGCIYLICGVHLLPASELLGFLTLTVALDLVGRGRPRTRLAGLRLLADLLLVAAATWLFVHHPAFAAMKDISNNDGSLYTLYIHTKAGIAWFCLAIAALAAVLVWRWRQLATAGQGISLLSIKYVGLYGLAVAGMCLLQLISLKLGQGSDYAVKKHLFALNSVLFLEIAMLPGLLSWCRAPAPTRTAAQGTPLTYQYLLLPLLAGWAFHCVTPVWAGQDVSELVQMEHQLTLRRDLLLPMAPHRDVYVLDLPGLAPQFGYMYSLGIFRTSRDAALNILLPRAKAVLDGVVITAPETAIGKVATCQLPGSDRFLTLLDGACLTRELISAQPRVGLSSNDVPPPCQLRGLSFPEPSGSWTDGNSVSMDCPLPTINGHAPHSVTLTASAYVQGSHQQHIAITVNNAAPVHFIYDASHSSQEMQVMLPADASQHVMVHLSLPDAISPKDLGLGEDARKLGIIVKSLEFK